MDHKPKLIPPKLAEKILSRIIRDDLAEEVLGDLEEKFYSTVEKKSSFKAKLNYWYQVFNYLRPFAIKKSRLTHSNYTAMYKNYFKMGYRNLLRNKGYSLINISGLAVGMAVSIFIGLWIYDELSFDNIHKENNRIAQVMQHQTFNGDKRTQYSIPFPLGGELETKYKSDFKYVVMSGWAEDHILSYKDNRNIRKGNYMDVQAPHLLSLEMISGTRNGLIEPHSILLSKSLSQSLFPNRDPMGEIMEVDNELTVKVTGIYEDLLLNSSFSELGFIVPWDLYVSSYDWVASAKERPVWDNNSFQLYVQLVDQSNLDHVNEKIKNVKYDHLNEHEKSLLTEIFLHPMSDWHLRSNWENGVKTGGLIQYVWLFGVIGLFVLLLACVNFMNLSTANSLKRAKEIGIRKSIGSFRIQLIQQFLCESFLVVFMGFILSILLVWLAIPYFNLTMGKQVSIPYAYLPFWLIVLGFIVVTGFLAGSYPALYLSSFRPVKVLNGTFKAGLSAAIFRRLLVVLQFTVSVMIILGTIMISKQVQYAKDRPLGFEKQGIITIEISTEDYEGKYNLLRNELISSGGIVDMTESSSPMTEVENSNGGFDWEGKDPGFRTSFATVWVTHDFGNTVGWEVLEGRDFSRGFSTDSSTYILNEAAVKYMGIENPIGKIVKWGKGDHKVIGVVKDMLMESPFKSVMPTIYIIDYIYNADYITLKLNPEEGVSTSLVRIENVLKKIVPEVPFNFSFVDQEYAKKFATEERIAILSGTFALLAIFISCLGLFGLVSFVAEQRTKEIGIRKVLGASILNLWIMLTREFVLLVVLSSIIAIPIAWYVIALWLGNYEYRTNIEWWVFAVTALGALIITLFSVSFQAVKAAMMNPVNSLRSE